MADTKTTTKYEDRLRELSKRAEWEPWQIRLFLSSGLQTGTVLKGYQIIRVSDDELSYKRLATTTPTEDRWLPASEANVNLMTFQRNSAEATAELVEAARESLKGGSHEGDCDKPDPYGPCEVHVETCRLRHERLSEALAALDEEAQR